MAVCERNLEIGSDLWNLCQTVARGFVARIWRVFQIMFDFQCHMGTKNYYLH